MMPDLGNYTLEVLLAYGISLSLLAGVVWASWARARRVSRALAEIEARQDA